MSKYLKNLMAEELKGRLVEVNDALVVDVIGIEANATMELRKELREKNIQLMVVKNSLARRATEGTALAPAFEGSSGTQAVIWGSEDVVSLAKEVMRLAGEEKYGSFGAKGGVMDGAKLSAEEVSAVSKWPSRQEQLSLLVGQILGPGATLSAQLLGPGGALASQVEQKSQE
ncbi:MAG: 50S ribosomal protein L10 [Planctomycetaceae bacterium]|nr:50S ribosomal protein L10 [Planctomycetaceae bacterium]HCK41510.1 50S ribosomal protein L10 [Planctomycetaceae bacterium]|tara:strand:+ start:934 stop:1449 length:516 start_codon:yes stop_codon:yes gene_type:complete